MIHNIISGIIFSEFNDIKGPMALAFFPLQLSQTILNRVSTLTIDFFFNETAQQEMLYLVPFPFINKKGLVRSIIWPDSKKRGGKALGSLTLLFEEHNDSIFYKYLKDFEEPLDQVAKKLINLRRNNSKVKDLEKTLEDLHSEILQILGTLAERELPIKDKIEEFPESAFQSGKKIFYTLKIIVVGDPSVGKTSTVLRFSDNAFTRSYIPTLGVNISQKFINHHGKGIQLMLWDLAGQSKFQDIRHQFYKGAHGAIMVYDLTDHQSFENIPKWHEDLLKSLGAASKELGIILCGNKKDLADNRTVSIHDVMALANKLKINFIETSALSGENINELFIQLIDTLLKQLLPEILNK